MAAFENHQVRESRLRLTDALQQTENHVHAAAAERRRQQETQTHLQRLVEAHPQYVNIDASGKFHYILFLLSIPCVYFIDVLLFSPVAQFVVQQAFPDSAILANVARYIVPAGIIGIELTIATQIYRGSEERREFGSSSSLTFWKTFGGFVVLSIVFGIVATVLAIMTGGSGPSLTFAVMGLALALLAMVSHVSLIFAGGLASDAKGFLSFSFERRRLQSALTSSQSHFDRAMHAAAATFRRYVQNLDTHNVSFPGNRIQAGPFTRDARQLLNEHFGYVVIEGPTSSDPVEQQPARSSPNPPDPAPRNTEENHPSSDQQSTADSFSNSYLHTILQRRIRDEEGEVKL